MEEENISLVNYEDLKMFAKYYPVEDDTIIISLEYDYYRKLWLDYLLENPNECPGSDNTMRVGSIKFRVLMK